MLPIEIKENKRIQEGLRGVITLYFDDRDNTLIVVNLPITPITIQIRILLASITKA